MEENEILENPLEPVAENSEEMNENANKKGRKSLFMVLAILVSLLLIVSAISGYVYYQSQQVIEITPDKLVRLNMSGIAGAIKAEVEINEGEIAIVYDNEKEREAVLKILEAAEYQYGNQEVLLGEVFTIKEQNGENVVIKIKPSDSKDLKPSEFLTTNVKVLVDQMPKLATNGDITPELLDKFMETMDYTLFTAEARVGERHICYKTDNDVEGFIAYKKPERGTTIQVIYNDGDGINYNGVTGSYLVSSSNEYMLVYSNYGLNRDKYLEQYIAPVVPETYYDFEEVLVAYQKDGYTCVQQ